MEITCGKVEKADLLFCCFEEELNLSQIENSAVKKGTSVDNEFDTYISNCERNMWSRSLEERKQISAENRGESFENNKKDILFHEKSCKRKGINIDKNINVLDSAEVDNLTAVSRKFPDARVAESEVEVLSQDPNGVYDIVTQNVERDISVEDNCIDSDKINEKNTSIKIVEETQEFSIENIGKKLPKIRRNNDIPLSFVKCENLKFQNSSYYREKVSNVKKSYETQEEELPKVSKTNEVTSPNISISSKISETFSYDDVNVIQKGRDNSKDVIHFSQNPSKSIETMLSPKIVEETEELCNENTEDKSPVNVKVEDLPIDFDDINFNQVEEASSQDDQKVNYGKIISKKINPKLSPGKKHGTKQTKSDKIGRDSQNEKKHMLSSSNDDIIENLIEVATCAKPVDSFLQNSPETEEKIVSPKIVGDSKEYNDEKIGRKFSEVFFDKLNDIQVEFCCQNSPKSRVENPKIIEETEELYSGNIEGKSPMKVEGVEDLSVSFISQIEGVNTQDTQKVNYSQNPFEKKNLKLSLVKKCGTEQAVSDRIRRESSEAQRKDRLPSSNYDKNTNPENILLNSFQEKLLSPKTIEKLREFSSNIERKSPKVKRIISFDDFNDRPLERVNRNDVTENVRLINSSEDWKKELNPKIREESEKLSSENIERRSSPAVSISDYFEGVDDFEDHHQNVNIDDTVESNFQQSRRSRITHLSSRTAQRNIKKLRRKNYFSSFCSDDSQVGPIASDDFAKEFSEKKNKMLNSDMTCETFNSFDKKIERESLREGTYDNISQLSSDKNYNKTLSKNNIETSIRSIDSVEMESPSVVGKSKNILDNLSLSPFKSPCFCGYESSDCYSQNKSNSQRRRKSKVKEKRLNFSLKDSIDFKMKDTTEKKVVEKSPLTKIKDFFFNSNKDKNACSFTNVDYIRKTINVGSKNITEKYSNGTVNTELKGKKLKLIKKRSKKEIEVCGTINQFLINDNISAGYEAGARPKKKRCCNTDEESPAANVSESKMRKKIKKVKYCKNDELNRSEVAEVGGIFNKGNSSARDNRNLDNNEMSSSKEQQKNKKSKEVNHGWMGRDEEGEKCGTNIDQDECIKNKKRQKHKKNVESWNDEIKMKNNDNHYSIAASAFPHGGPDEEEGITNPKKRKHKKKDKSKQNEDIEAEQGDTQYHSDVSTSANANEKEMNAKEKRKHKKKKKSYDDEEKGTEEVNPLANASTNSDHEEEKLMMNTKKKKNLENNGSSYDDETENKVNKFSWAVGAATVDRDEGELINPRKNKKHKNKGKSYDDVWIEAEEDNPYISAMSVSDHDEELIIPKKKKRHQEKKKKHIRSEKSYDGEGISFNTQCLLDVDSPTNAEEELINLKKKKHKKKRKSYEDDNRCSLAARGYSAGDCNDGNMVNPMVKKKHKNKDTLNNDDEMETENDYNLNYDCTRIHHKKKWLGSRKKLRQKNRSKLEEIGADESTIVEHNDEWTNMKKLSSCSSLGSEACEVIIPENDDVLFRKEKSRWNNDEEIEADYDTIIDHDEKSTSKKKDRLRTNEEREADVTIADHDEVLISKEKSRNKKDRLRTNKEREADVTIPDHDDVLISKEKSRNKKDRLRTNKEREADVTIPDHDDVLISKEKSRNKKGRLRTNKEREADVTIPDHDDVLISKEKSRSSNDEESEAGGTVADDDGVLISKENSRSSNDEGSEADEDACDGVSSVDVVWENNEKKEIALSSKEKLNSSDENKGQLEEHSHNHKESSVIVKRRSRNDSVSSSASECNKRKRRMTRKNTNRWRDTNVDCNSQSTSFDPVIHSTPSCRHKRLSKQNNSSGEIVEDTSDAVDEDSTVVPRSFEEVEVADFLDDSHRLNVFKLNKTIAEISQHKERITDAFMNLNIKLNWKVPKSPRIRNLTETDAPKFSKYFLKGRFTEEETNYLWEAWNEFCETYNLDHSDFSAFLPDPISRRKVLRNKKKLDFVLYLSKNLRDRAPAAVYRKFIRMNCKKWDFTAEEDQFLIEMYEHYNGKDLNAVCAQILNRHKNNICKRFSKLTEDGLIDKKSRMVIHGDELERTDLRNRILLSLMRRRGNDLKIVYAGTWNSIGQEFSMSPGNAKLIFFAELYPQLFAHHPIRFYTYVIGLIQRLKNEKHLSWNGLPWQGIARKYHNTAPIFLYTLLRQLIIKHVPSELWTRLRECIEYIDETIIPIYEEKERNGEDCWYLGQIKIVE